MAKELSRRLPSLDGLRALAVIAVIIAHSNLYFGDHASLIKFTGYFREGVDLFFAISGMLITTLLIAEYEHHGHLNFRSFYVRRAFRILPPVLMYFVVIGALAALGLVAVKGWEVSSSLLFYRNYMFYHAEAGSVTGHFWSLSVEEHFYLLWPFCIGLFARKRGLIVAVGMALLVAFWRGLDSHYHIFARVLPDAGPIFRSDTRLDALLWGAAAGLILPKVRSCAGWRFGAILPYAAFTAIVICEYISFPAIPVIRAVGYAVIVLSCVVWAESRTLRWLGARWLERIGVLSYSIYIWQTPWLQSNRLSARGWPRRAAGEARKDSGSGVRKWGLHLA